MNTNPDKQETLSLKQKILSADLWISLVFLPAPIFYYIYWKPFSTYLFIMIIFASINSIKTLNEYAGAAGFRKNDTFLKFEKWLKYPFRFLFFSVIKILKAVLVPTIPIVKALLRFSWWLIKIGFIVGGMYAVWTLFVSMPVPALLTIIIILLLFR